MKPKIWTHHLISAVFAFVLSVSAIGNLITGYDLPIDSLWKIYLWCGIFSLVTSAMLRFRYGGRLLLCLAGAGILLFWKMETVVQQIQQQTQCLGFILSSHYHHVYDWPVLGNPTAGEVSFPLILWAALVAVSVNWYICRRKHIAFAIFPAVVPLILCLFTTDRVPDTQYLYLLILGLAVLLVTDWTTKKYPAQGMKLILRLVLPMAASLALLFALHPREAYVNNAGKLQKEVVSWFQEFQDSTGSVVSGTSIVAPVTEKLNLRNVGPKSRISYSVMRVSSPIGGMLYLRGRDYDEYTGTGWEASSDRKEEFTSGGTSAGELTIVTYGVRNVRYVPYYATEEIHLVGGACENEENLQRYSYSLSQTASGNSGISGVQYLELPEDTLQWAWELTAELTNTAISESEKIIRIQNYVRGSAVYDLSTSRMDAQYGDFARWFLEESETGCCVHFATAATVLLRAAGIPARYVEGFMINCDGDSDVVVTNQDAHAWAEYYDADSGAWRVLEATPADPEDEETEPAVTIPETETIPEATEAETEESDTEPNVPEDTPTKPNPSSEGVIGQDGDRVSFQIPVWITTVFKCLLLAACIPLQGMVRIYWKRTQWNRGRPNERTMNRWRQTHTLSKLLKQPYPEELDTLALKAKFSQHRIQPEELQQFEEYWISLLGLVHSKPWYHRMIFKWILAIDSRTTVSK